MLESVKQSGEPMTHHADSRSRSQLKVRNLNLCLNLYAAGHEMSVTDLKNDVTSQQPTVCMDGLVFYVVFDSISVNSHSYGLIDGLVFTSTVFVIMIKRWKGDYERQ